MLGAWLRAKPAAAAMESLATLDVWENRALLRHDMATFRRSPVPFMHDSDDEEDEDDDDYVDYDVSNRRWVMT